MKLRGRIALITGGTGELGKAVVKHFQNEGAEVVVAYHSDTEATEFLKSFPDVLTLKGDVSKQNDVDQIFKSLLDKKGGIDILCNLVGGYMPKKNITELTEKEWEFMFTLNLKTCFLCSQSCTADNANKKRTEGSLTFQRWLDFPLSAGRGAYGISKSAIAAFTRIAGEEAKSLPESNITVNAIAPSILLTESNKRSLSKEETKGWVTLEQAASVIGFLASDEASSINGETIKVYGGI